MELLCKLHETRILVQVQNSETTLIVLQRELLTWPQSPSTILQLEINFWLDFYYKITKQKENTEFIPVDNSHDLAVLTINPFAIFWSHRNKNSSSLICWLFTIEKHRLGLFFLISSHYNRVLRLSEVSARTESWPGNDHLHRWRPICPALRPALWSWQTQCFSTSCHSSPTGPDQIASTSPW